MEHAHDLPAVVPPSPTPAVPPEVLESVAVSGDLSGLTAAQRLAYYQAVCRSLGLNPLTKPFEYLTLNGKLRLYALRDCADQLRRLHGISISITSRERLGDIYVVTARARDRTGREDESIGAVALGSLKGDALANALMKAETKAKRRVTLSLAGLGWLDETEVTTMPGAHTGEPVNGDVPDFSPPNGEVEKFLADAAENSPNGDTPTPTTIPAGLPCAGQTITQLSPAQLRMLLSKVDQLAAEQGSAWRPLLEALAAERQARLDQGRKKTLPQPAGEVLPPEDEADVP
jgi:hypothetical protein